jgi:hypothetical protein
MFIKAETRSNTNSTNMFGIEGFYFYITVEETLKML